MPVALVELFVSATNSKPAVPVADVTALALAGQPIVYNVGKPWALRYFWVRIVDDAGNEKVTELGSYRTQDNTPPVVDISLALGTPTVSTVNVTYSVTDASDQVIENYIHIGTVAPTTAAAVRATGVEKALNATSHTFTGLQAATQYYVTVLGRDHAGNATIQTASITTATDNTPPNLDSYLIRAPTAAEGNVELVAVIQLVVSDVVAHQE